MAASHLTGWCYQVRHEQREHSRHGPYNADTMGGWYTEGYLDRDTLVARCLHNGLCPLDDQYQLKQPPAAPDAGLSLTHGFCYQSLDAALHGPYDPCQFVQWREQGYFPNGTLVASCSHEAFAPIGDAPPWEAPSSALPEGWVCEPSISRPGQITYVNTHTRERQDYKPSAAAPALPNGWQLVPSRTRPGMHSFLNTVTQQRQKHIPTSRATDSPTTDSRQQGCDQASLDNITDAFSQVHISQAASNEQELSVRMLKAQLTALGLSFEGLLEKGELVELLKEAKTHALKHRPEPSTSPGAANMSPGAATAVGAANMSPGAATAVGAAGENAVGGEYLMVLDTCVLLDDRERAMLQQLKLTTPQLRLVVPEVVLHEVDVKRSCPDQMLSKAARAAMRFCGPERCTGQRQHERCSDIVKHVADDEVLSCAVYWHRQKEGSNGCVVLLTKDKGLQRKAQLTHGLYSCTASALQQNWARSRSGSRSPAGSEAVAQATAMR